MLERKIESFYSGARGNEWGGKRREEIVIQSNSINRCIDLVRSTRTTYCGGPYTLNLGLVTANLGLVTVNLVSVQARIVGA